MKSLETQMLRSVTICLAFCMKCSTELQIIQLWQNVSSGNISQPSTQSRQALPHGRPTLSDPLEPNGRPILSDPLEPPNPSERPQPEPRSGIVDRGSWTGVIFKKVDEEVDEEVEVEVDCCNRDKDCVYWGDCCLDTFKPEYSGADYIAYFLQRTEVRKYFKKIPILNKKLNPTHRIDANYMIGACGNISSSFYRTCNYLYSDDDFPVYDENEVVYRNLACAKCHNESGSFLEVGIRITWCTNIKSHMNVSEPSSFSLADLENCKFVIDHPKKYLHSNLRDEFFRKPENMLCSEIERLLCENHMYAIRDEDYRKWANPYCFSCNYGIMLQWNCSNTDFERYQRTKEQRKSGQSTDRVASFPFSLMVSRTNEGVVEDHDAYGHVKRSTRVCGSGFIFDILQGKCTEYHCEAGYIKSSGKCMRGYQKNIKIDSGFGQRDGSIANAIKQCMSNFTGSVIYKLSNNPIQKNVSSFQNKTNLLFFENNGSFFISRKEKITNKFFSLNFDIITDIGSAPETMYISLLSTLPATFLFGFSPKHHMNDGRICKSPLVHESFSVSTDCNIILNGTEYQLTENGTFWMESSRNGVKYFASICPDSNLFLRSSCAKQFYSNSLVTVDSNLTASIKTEYLNLTLEASEYLPEANGIKICVPETRRGLFIKNSGNFSFEYLVWDIEFYIAISLLCVSLLCELLLLVTYTSIKELQNTPGRIVMALSTVLGLNDASFLGLIAGAPLTERICDIFGPFLHWLSISLHLWTVVLAYDLWRTFRHSFQRRENNRGDFLKFGTVVCSVSTLIVGVVLILEQFTEFKVEYGVLKGNDSCWITSVKGRLYSYLVPSYIILACTIILLASIMRNIKQNMEPKMSAQSNRNMLAIILKLTCALGIPEIISVIGVPRDTESLAILSHVITLLHNILRSSRGIFLFAIFVLTKNVIKHTKKKMIRQNNTSTLSAVSVGANTAEVSV